MLNVLLQATPAVVILGIPEMHVSKSTVPHRQAPHLQLISQENHTPVIRRNNNYYKLIEMNLFHLWTWLAFWKYEVKSHSEHSNHKVFRKLFFFTHSPIASLVACVAWWFRLGAQSNKGRRGQRNRKEIGARATRNHLLGRAAFLNSLYACVQIVPIGSECSPLNQIFGNLQWESSKWLKKSSLQNKIKVSKNHWPKRWWSWIFDGKTGKWSFAVFFIGEMLW